MSCLNEILEEVKQQFENGEIDFHTAIYEARERMGIKMYRAAEHIGVTMHRLQRLESGMFRAMPLDRELEGINKLYGFLSKKCRKTAINTLK